MSILIKGMEMPIPGAYTCELGVLDNNTAVLTIYTPIDEPQRSYRLAPVPPHGRLIDADALIDAGWQLSRDNIFTGKYEIALLSSVPTIIEAKGRETDENQT